MIHWGQHFVSSNKMPVRSPGVSPCSDGEDEEAPEEAAVDEDEEVPEKLRRAQEKERQLRELQQAEFGVGWRLRLNARPMAVSGAPAAVLGLFLAQEGPLLLAASADASVHPSLLSLAPWVSPKPARGNYGGPHLESNGFYNTKPKCFLLRK